MESVQLQKLCQIEARRYVLIVGMVGITYLMLQYFMLPYGNALKSLLPDNEILLSVKSGSLSGQLLVKSAKEGEIHASDLVGVVKQDGESDGGVYSKSDDEGMEIDRSVQEIIEGKGRGQMDENDTTTLHNTDAAGRGVNDSRNENELSALEMDVLRKNSSISKSENVGHVEQIVALERQSSPDDSMDSTWNQAGLVLPKDVEDLPQSDFPVLHHESRGVGRRRRKKARPGMPPISVVSMDMMNHRLARHLASSRRRKPQWSSLREPDKEILDAKLKLIGAGVSNVDEKLYAPVFRNVSTFIRSYELMEQTLKVYVYRDGKKPIFHQPILKGLYASEGWFMKLMEGSKRFLVKNPEKAHLFYMPFSSRMLEYALYLPGSHNRTQLRQFVKNYTETMAAKYPFWNRTGGRDHFIVACHDWAPYETRHHMENSIKALCNADITVGFKIGRDVSLPETFVRYARNPLRDIGGKPPSKRTILAFYAGNSHGYLRPILLNHWKDKDPAMRIYGLLPQGVSRRMNYIQHMKSSKYCICPKGFEVNSPRIVEAIYYECVPVIISDNFVPPFFEVLNWEAFSVILAEKDIPNLKNILLAITDEKYAEMQLAVRKVQQHFLWHARPVKYDLFHMTLHSIWNSRVFQI